MRLERSDEGEEARGQGAGEGEKEATTNPITNYPLPITQCPIKTCQTDHLTDKITYQLFS
ncbi:MULTISPECIES: hypothetical protein [unclassified Tolypothrix]|uniref:hypothetical protein n=1 Tax=unclassified Tolypothrix TaxID=2649714 RepID=UPI0012D7F3ED|nr:MULTISPECIES: hypothetical protein [unclassified Tolypothrix]UYD31988.1 hypothetical protein HG267_23235 [Tolypothrix sp. PCC 7601]